MTNTTSAAARPEYRVNRPLGYAAIVVAASVIGSTLFGWAVIGLTTLLRD